MSNYSTHFLKLISILVLVFTFNFSYGASPFDSSNLFPTDTIYSDSVMVDSIIVIPSIPHEGEQIKVLVTTRHTSSACGLLDYTVQVSASNVIFVNARYWQGMLTAMCTSTDTFRLGTLNAGKYVLNFMNSRKIEFTVYPKPGCDANFIYDYPKCGDSAKCVNTVAFYDKSTGNIKSWYWDFGDSTTSSQQNPVHSYKTSGVYNVCLTVNPEVSSGCTSTECKLVPVQQASCKALFKYSVINGLPMVSAVDSSVSPLPVYIVKFTDLSVDSVEKWYWDFGDSTFSSDQNPVHYYKDGKYLVTLHIVTKYGCESYYSDTLNLQSTIPLCKYTGVVKDYSGLDGCGYIIELDNGTKLEPVIVSVPFVFHDNQRVIVDYRALKIFTTCMVGIPAEITCIREMSDSVCRAQFTWYKDTLANCLCYKFIDRSEGGAIKWYWNFGDGTTSEEQNPRHVFQVNNDSMGYTVCLTIKTASGCTSTYCETIYVNSQAPWVPIIGGEENHNIVVSGNIVSSANLEAGDYIGLFFRDYFGNLKCGGMVRWEGVNAILTAWQNTCYFDSIIYADSSIIPVPYIKNGFTIGEKFEYKIWKWRTNEEKLIQNASYSVSYLFPDSGYFAKDGLSLLAQFKTSAQHKVNMHNGWNLTSLNIVPENPRMQAMFGANENIIVKNFKGEIVYFPKMGINDGIWNMYEGYKIKTFQNSSFTFSGEPIHPQTIIPLNGTQFPNFLPYYYDRPYSIEQMMFAIRNNIRYVQTFEYVNGMVRALNYIPKYGIDQIKYMKPGFAYKLSLYMAIRSFVYPVPNNTDSIKLLNNYSVSTDDADLLGESNRILVIPESILPISEGAEITARTADGTIVGNEISEGGNIAVTLWDLASGIAYDTFVLEVNDGGEISDYTYSFTKNTSQDENIYVLESTTGINDSKTQKQVVRVYPTLVDQEFTIDIKLDKSSNVEVCIFNMQGNKLKQYTYPNLSLGLNSLKVNALNLAPGQYMYQVKFNNQVERGKVCIMK